MPAFSRALVLGLQAAALLSLLGPSSAPGSMVALAAPLASPAPPGIRIVDYAAQPPMVNKTNTTALAAIPATEQHDGMVVEHTPSDSAVQRRSLDILSSMTEHLQIISGLAGRASTEGSDPQFCQEVVGAVSSYKTDLLGFQTFLGETDKGLGNYDPSNELETAIKEMVNSVKESLKWIDALAYSIPGVGPELGELVYEIKCILIDLLDMLEDLLDGLLNGLRPTLEALIGEVGTTSCRNGWACDGVL